MYKVLISILFCGLFSQGAFAQVDDYAIDTLEEITVPPPQIEGYDDEYDNNEEYEDAEYDDNAYGSASNKEFVLRRVDKVEWERLKKDKRFQYKKEKKKEKKKIDPPPTPWFDGIGRFFSSAFFKLLLYTFLAAFLLYIIYLFVKNNNISFKRNIKDKEVVQEDPWEDVTRFEDWELALQKALANGDYRLATRIYYLHALNILDKNSFVKYRDDKTNWYYVQKLFGTPLHDDFKELTRSFDYIWYGEYQINKEQFDVLATQFKNFKVQIS